MYVIEPTPDQLHNKLASAVTQYDIKQEGKRGYNRYALPQYLAAVSRTVRAVNAGVNVERAILENFNGRLARELFKTIGIQGEELERWTKLAR